MKLFELTNQGLTVIGLLICVLWGVLLVERDFNEQARRDYYELLERRAPAMNAPSASDSPLGSLG